MNTSIIIPSLNPDEKLIHLVRELKRRGFDHIVVIDDGSGSKYQHIFESLTMTYKCSLIKHPENLGKGMALKHGLIFAEANFPEDSGCVTVDADGQHAVEDIIRVSKAVYYQKNSLVLGVRRFGENTPLKSVLGNRISAKLFRLLTHRVIHDTQTGLRGIPRNLIHTFVNVSGERYEYEMNVLFKAVRVNVPFYEVEIETIYLNDNKGSHFRPIKDSARVLKEVTSFGLSGALSAGLDILAFFMLSTFIITGQVFLANVLARLISGLVNFSLNRKLVFKDRDKVSRSAVKYGLLFSVQLVLSSGLVSLFTYWVGYPILAKVIVDLMLFTVSFQIQKRYVFKKSILAGEKSS